MTDDMTGDMTDDMIGDMWQWQVTVTGHIDRWQMTVDSDMWLMSVCNVKFTIFMKNNKNKQVLGDALTNSEEVGADYTQLLFQGLETFTQFKHV